MEVCASRDDRWDFLWSRLDENWIGNQLSLANLYGFGRLAWNPDLTARQLIARWPITGAETPNSMALDEPHHRLFIATRNPPKMFVFDTDSGKIVTSVPISTFNDDMW